ncbi:MAG: twin-arginine translocation signal domain-containing protein, partial [Acidimicrobiales bacterium]
MSNKPLSRRTFIGAAGATAGAVAVGRGVWATMLSDSVEQSALIGIGSAPSTTTTLASSGAVPYGDRILVVLEMAGGNDAINTLVPGSGLYKDARRELALPSNELVTLAGTDYTLHPALAPLAPHWDAGSMAAVAGVGLMEQ